MGGGGGGDPPPDLGGFRGDADAERPFGWKKGEFGILQRLHLAERKDERRAIDPNPHFLLAWKIIIKTLNENQTI